MCLYLKSVKTRKQIAKKDIIVYKALDIRNKKINSVDKLKKLKHGDSFSGVINSIECEGKVSIDFIGRIFFCTNEEKLNGNRTSDRFGYKYSWIKDPSIKKIIVNDETIYNIECVDEYYTPYQQFEVKIGETYFSKLDKWYNIVEKGLHSFETLKDAKDCRDIIAKCIIPKGSEYYKGMFNDNISYASNKLTYLEIIE